MTDGKEIDEACVFCSIANKKSFARIVYETEELLCLFPARPEVQGHTLIISREHFESILYCPPGFGESLLKACKVLSDQYGQSLSMTGFNLLNANGVGAEQSVQHLHFHFLPRYSSDEFSAWPILPGSDVDLDELLERVRIDR